MDELDFYFWKTRFLQEGLTTTARFELRQLLEPKISVKKRIRWTGRFESGEQQGGDEDPLSYELVLAAHHAASALSDLDSESWSESLPLLLGDFQQLLEDALNLLQEVGGDTDREDQSYWHLPSISPHHQNRGFHDWVVLIELVRDAWLTVRKKDVAEAGEIAKDWFSKPYLTFKRLAMFAAGLDDCIDGEQWVGWLTDDEAWLLWSVPGQREMFRLLVLQGRKLNNKEKARLEGAILQGPPRSSIRSDISQAEWVEISNLIVLLRLAKLQSSGAGLGAAARERFDQLSALLPVFKLADDERDEFPFWMGQGEFLNEDLPRKGRANRKSDAERWNAAFQNWSKDGYDRRSWRHGARVVANMSDHLLNEVAHGLSWWIRYVAKSVDLHQHLFLELCNRLLKMQFPGTSDSFDVLTRAINHPVGHVANALVDFWFNRRPNDDDGLPADLEPLFTSMADTRVEHFRHARVTLATHVVAFFRVDQKWTVEKLIPLFSWERNVNEAQAAWMGFLWSPRVFRPLLIALKKPFLETSDHYELLGELGGQYAAFLTFVALESVETYSSLDFQKAFRMLPDTGLRQSAEALVNALKGAGSRREEYWENRVMPFWRNVWPKSRRVSDPRIASSFALLSIEAGKRFPNALGSVHAWIQPIKHPYRIIHQLIESNASTEFPQESLRLLDAVIGREGWVSHELLECLQAIAETEPSLREDTRYQRLVDFARTRSG